MVPDDDDNDFTFKLVEAARTAIEKGYDGANISRHGWRVTVSIYAGCSEEWRVRAWELLDEALPGVKALATKGNGR